jgi:hypothetical protein
VLHRLKNGSVRISQKTNNPLCESAKGGVKRGDVEQGYNFLNKDDAEIFRKFFAEKFPEAANPGPIGLGGFALTTFVLSMFNAGAIVG